MNVITKALQRVGINLLSQKENIYEYARQDKNRLSYRLKRQRVFVGDLEQKHLKLALMQAEDPENPQRFILYTIYKEILRDFHLRSQMRTALNEVIGEPWAVIDKKTKQVHPQLTELLQKQWFDELSKHVLSAEFWGHSLIQFGVMKPTEKENAALAPFEFDNVLLFPREHVSPERGLILLDPYDSKGIPFREPPFDTWLLEAGDPTDLGLLSIAAKYGLYKKYTLSDWSRSSEKWSDPLLVIHSSSDDDKENDKKEEMAANFGNNGYVILDDDDKVELLERSNGSGYKIFEDFANYLDKENSKGVNGQTGTSDEKAFVGGAEVHERILGGYTEARLRNLFYFHNDKTIPFLIGKGYKLEGYQWMPLRLLNEKKKPTQEPGGAPEKKPLSLATGSAFIREVNSLYNHSCGHDHGPVSAYESSINMEVLMERALKRWHTNKAAKLDRDLVYANARELLKGIKEGFKDPSKMKYGSAEHRLLLNLRHNVHVTAAFKNYQNTLEVSRELFDEEGNIRSRSRFIKAARPVVETFNKNYLTAEYDTAVGTARMASKWAGFQDKGGKLTYKTIGDGRVRQEHAALEGVTLPVNDPFWQVYYPPNGWKCRCYVRWAPDDTPNKEPVERPELKESFKNNAGITGKVFTEDHPYFQINPEDAREAGKLWNINMPVSPDEFAQNVLQYNELIADVNNFNLEFIDNLSGGFVFKHKQAVKREISELLPVSKRMASESYGVVIRPVDNTPGTKNPDLLLGAKHCEVKNNYEGTFNSIDRQLREAKKQAGSVVLNMAGSINLKDLESVIYYRINRSPGIEEVFVLLNNKLFHLKREEILSKSFFGKIKK
jgi:SPP1 gp7 family putative phage head morphogenesis protein